MIDGSFERALPCDLRIAGESATMRLPEILHGIVPDSGGTALEIAWGIASRSAFSVQMFRRTLGSLANPLVQRSLVDEALAQSMVFQSAD